MKNNQYILCNGKIPCDVSRIPVNAQDSLYWFSESDAKILAATLNLGYGFVFTSNDPYWVIDIDGALQPDNTWSVLANELMGLCAGAYIEVSQSGRGLHIIGTGVVPEHSSKNTAIKIELYTEGRFIALTGTNAIGNCEHDCSAVLPGIVDKYFPPATAVKSVEWTDTHVPQSNPIQDDDELIKRACNSGSAASKFGGKASFNDLWTRNVEALAEAYPDDKRDYDASSADAALAQHLCYWTGNNAERIERLMWKSGLVRDKWTKHKNLLRGYTIPNAMSMQTSFYGEGVTATSVKTSISDPIITSGYQLLAVQQQLEHFKGCVYIQDIHRIFTPTGALLKPEQFNVVYGGYHFQMESDGGGKTSKKAWEAFTESQAIRFPKAETSCFRPDLKSGQVIESEGRLLVNTYVPIVTECKQGDVSLFLNHMIKLLPVEHDREILLAYMAACIQYKGVKFQWAPLIQGVEGNGKTLFSRCVDAAIGDKYTHWPPADQISEKFNAWLFEKLFIAVEDIYVPDHRTEIIETLKPMITNKRLAKRAMQTDQIMHDVCSNFMFNSNHKDAVRKNRNDRRFCIFYTAQQQASDIERDGLDGDYFPNMYRWLDNGGYAAVTYFLTHYKIPDALNPAGKCHRAPITSTTDEAINEALGGIEQELKEAIDEGRQGFRGGWISSFSFDQLLNEIGGRYRINRNKRGKIIESFGYVHHPALKEGRMTKEIYPGQGKPRIYIKQNHIHCNLKSVDEIKRCFLTAQNTIDLPPIDEYVSNK